MVGAIITGHAQFASGMVNAAVMLLGDDIKIIGIDYDGGDTKELTERIINAVNAFEKSVSVFILCDIMGGTPYRTAATATRECENVLLLYGANLDMVMDLCMRNYDNEIPESKELAAEIMQIGKDRIGVFSPPSAEEDNSCENEGL